MAYPEQTFPAARRTTIDRPTAQGDVHASPSVRQLARELGVALDRVAATGPKGRILREDLHAFVKAALQAPGPGARRHPPGSAPACRPGRR